MGSLTVANHFFYGFVNDGHERYFFEPLSGIDSSCTLDYLIVYKESDVKVNGNIKCGSNELKDKTPILKENQRNNSSNKQSLSQRFQKNETKNLEVGKINNNEKNENLVVDINKQNDLITNPKTKIVNKQFSKPIPRPNFNQNQKPKNQGKQLNQSSQTNSVKANSNVATEKRTQQNPNNSDKTQNKQINEKRNSHQSRNNSQSRNSDLKSN